MTNQESFYLGREYDLQEKKILDQPVLYDAHDLTTHGVVVGMTGSGKTGLCITLMEEAALQGMRGKPAIEILAFEIREAAGRLQELLGEISSDEILGKIFSGFCIGK